MLGSGTVRLLVVLRSSSRFFQEGGGPAQGFAVRTHPTPAQLHQIARRGDHPLQLDLVDRFLPDEDLPPDLAELLHTEPSLGFDCGDGRRRAYLGAHTRPRARKEHLDSTLLKRGGASVDELDDRLRRDEKIYTAGGRLRLGEGGKGDFCGVEYADEHRRDEFGIIQRIEGTDALGTDAHENLDSPELLRGLENPEHHVDVGGTGLCGEIPGARDHGV